MLVCWRWRFEWSFAVVTTTTSTNLSSNKIQNRDILVLANADPPGIMAVKTDTDRQTDRQTEGCSVGLIRNALHLGCVTCRNSSSAVMQHKSWGFDFRHNEKLLPTTFGQYSTELFTSEAERIIANHDISKVCMSVFFFLHPTHQIFRFWKRSSQGLLPLR